MASIRLERLVKTYPNGQVAIRDASLAVADGEFVVLVGPSGCGKSTLLRLVAGLESPDEGRVWLGEEDVTALAPQARDLAMVFQHYALYPHMRVRDNLGYGLKVRGVERAAIARRVAEVSALLRIDDVLDRLPAQLSGGQRQRVALGRALARQPKAFLLDEPLSNLDAALRAHARAELRRLHQQMATTVVYVTHDQQEAMTLGSRVVVLRDGAVEQEGAPLDLYARPASAFVAGFIGSPPMNLVPAASAGFDAPAGAVAGIRPHDVWISTGHGMQAQVELVEPLGRDTLVHLRVENLGEMLRAAVPSAAAPAAGAVVRVTLSPHAVHLFDGQSGRRLA